MADLGKKVWKRPVINEAARPDVSNIDFAGEIIVKGDAECELARRAWNVSIDRYPRQSSVAREALSWRTLASNDQRASAANP